MPRHCPFLEWKVKIKKIRGGGDSVRRETNLDWFQCASVDRPDSHPIFTVYMITSSATDLAKVSRLIVQ